MKIGEILLETTVDEGVNDPHLFKCIFLFGPMGAGKSTVAGPLLAGTGLRSVNLDNFNELFVKKGQVSTGNLSPDQLEKSWQLTQKQQSNYVDGRLGVIIDGSGRNPSTLVSVVEKLMPLGYEFMMIYVDVSLETSLTRQKERAERQRKKWGAGREVEEKFAIETYEQIKAMLPKYQAYFPPSRFAYINNESSNPYVAQARRKVDNFLSLPITQPEALEWIKNQQGGAKVAAKQSAAAAGAARQQAALQNREQTASGDLYIKKLAKKRLELPKADAQGFKKFSKKYKE